MISELVSVIAWVAIPVAFIYGPYTFWVHKKVEKELLQKSIVSDKTEALSLATNLSSLTSVHLNELGGAVKKHIRIVLLGDRAFGSFFTIFLGLGIASYFMK